MAEYIEREAAIKVLREKATANSPSSFYRGLFTASYELDDIPAADVAPVRHGRWEARAIPRSDPDGDWIALEYHCSLCNRLEYRKENYCPNCGAKMDGVDDE